MKIEEKEVMVAELEGEKVNQEKANEQIKDIHREMIELHETFDGVKAFHQESIEKMTIEKGRLYSRLTQAEIQIECDGKDLKKMKTKATEIELLDKKIDKLERTICKKAIGKMKRENTKLKRQMRNLFIQSGDGN